MALSTAERDALLAESLVAALAVTAEGGRGPLSVPVWYSYHPGADFMITTGGGSRKARLIASAGRFTLLVDRTAPTYRYVTAEGPVTSTAATTDEELAEISARYMPADKVPAYMEQLRSSEDDIVTIRMRPEHWLSADLGSA
jgi:nitroimidazol reductase NimA-like FMN-containing flavoprotein (pyridoxamine 5'-phosphate oxidase superfamily)